jgi:catechol 2,3-dioxygenase-like lactoylglutathione lyase family enzyme
VTPKVWYQVRDLERARAFYTDLLGFEQVHADDGWFGLVRGSMEIALAAGEPTEEGGVATIDVEDVKAEAERLRAAGVEVGVVVELHGQMRLLDVFDPDGNRIQLAQELPPAPRLGP